MSELNINFNTPIVDEMMTALENIKAKEPKRNYLGMSQIGDACLRKLWYWFRGYTQEPFPGRMIAIFEMGDDVEDNLKNYLEFAGHEITLDQAKFSTIDGYFRGHIDGVLDGKYLLEFKSANQRQFSLFVEKGAEKVFPKYIAQCQAYMGYSGFYKKAILMIMNKNDSSIHYEKISFDKKLFKALNKKAESIIYATEPPEKYEPCDPEYCNFSNICLNSKLHIQEDQPCGCCKHLEKIYYCGHHKRELPQKVWGKTMKNCKDWELKLWN